ncbi:hypothetical protein D3C73_827760 [compost metagenome]
MQYAGLTVDRNTVIHIEGMALQRRLELFETVIGQAYRVPVAVHRRHRTVVREVKVIFRTVTDGVARVQNQLFHRRIVFGQHAWHFVGHFLR